MVDSAFYPSRANEISNSRDVVVKSNLSFEAYFCYIFYLTKSTIKNIMIWYFLHKLANGIFLNNPVTMLNYNIKASQMVNVLM